MFAADGSLSASDKLTKRKEFRLRACDAERIKAAADAIGLQEADFIRQAALRQAEEVERRTMATVLAKPTFDAFLEALDQPAGIVPGLAAAAQRSKGVLKDV